MTSCVDWFCEKVLAEESNDSVEKTQKKKQIQFRVFGFLQVVVILPLGIEEMVSNSRDGVVNVLGDFVLLLTRDKSESIRGFPEIGKKHL